MAVEMKWVTGKQHCKSLGASDAGICSRPARPRRSRQGPSEHGWDGSIENAIFGSIVGG